MRLDDLTFERPRETARARGATGGADGLIEAATFARDDVDRIGVWDDEANARKFCCSTDMATRGLCEEGRGGANGGASARRRRRVADAVEDGDLVRGRRRRRRGATCRR